MFRLLVLIVDYDGMEWTRGDDALLPDLLIAFETSMSSVLEGRVMYNRISRELESIVLFVSDKVAMPLFNRFIKRRCNY